MRWSEMKARQCGEVAQGTRESGLTGSSQAASQQGELGELAASPQLAEVAPEEAAEEEAEPGMDIVREQMGVKYAGGHGEPKTAVATPNRATARGETARWIVFTPSKQITWDNFKLPRADG